MYSDYKGFGGGIRPLLTLFALTNIAAPAFADGATRDLPDNCSPDVTLTVSIAIDPPDGTLNYALEDSPPAGWTNIDSISDGGVYDSENHKVKWGAFFDDLSRTVTYDITPPGGATGTQCFDGTVSFDGRDEAIGGKSCLKDVRPGCWQAIPTVSEWGMVAMTLLLLTAGTLVLRRGQPARA
ncbi:MAG: IPTL-CTERM sorting domain-containing protein [Phycisphaerae bacterium]